MTGTIISDQSVGVYSFAEDMDVSDRRLLQQVAFFVCFGNFCCKFLRETSWTPLVSSCTIRHVP